MDRRHVDWEAVELDPVWTEALLPAIAQMREATLLALMSAEGEEVARLQGKAQALTDLAELPARMAADERYQRQLEREREDGNGAAGKPAWHRRIGARLQQSRHRG